MVKMEMVNFSSPDVPPGFEPLPPPTPASAATPATETVAAATPATETVSAATPAAATVAAATPAAETVPAATATVAAATSASTVTVAAVESSGNQNRTPNINGILSGHEEGENPDSIAKGRRTHRKRARPEFYRPPTRPRTVGPLGRGRFPREQAKAPARRRGRPPKDLLSPQETQNGDSIGASSTPLTRPQGQGQEPYYYQPVHLSKEQSSAQAVEPEPNKSGTTGERSAIRSNFFQNQSLEEAVGNIPFPEVPRAERSRNAGGNNKMSEGIDPKILQRVANALDYMAEVEYKNVYSRSPDCEKNLVRTIKAIEKKHGAITKNSSLESDCMKTLVMVGICKVVQDLEKKRLDELDISSLDSYYTAVRDAESMKVDVQWLHDRLDEIKEAVALSSEVKSIENERKERRLSFDRTKDDLVLRIVELERVKCEVLDLRDQLMQETAKVDELNEKRSEYMSKISQFQQGSLMDGLI